MNLAQTKSEITTSEARRQLWLAGILRWKLHPAQQEIYDAFYRSKARRFVLNCSRRLGKSYTLCALALEHAIRIENAEIKYCAPTQRQVKRVIFKLFKEILKDCPEEIKPVWFAQESVYEFPNGSTIAIGAMDSGRADALRGTDCHLGIVDEAGFSPTNYVQDMVDSVLRPMTLLTKGKICIASTPPKTPRHAFELYYQAAQLEDAAIHKTIYDNTLLTAQDIEEEMKAAGGENSTYWKREYLAQFVVDEDLVVIPEFSADKEAQVVKEVSRPSYYDAYVSMDVGFKDATGILFFYWDFKNAQLVVEDEALLHGVREVRTDLIADLIKIKETDLWGHRKPYFRISDADLLVLNDLDKLHNLKFTQAIKDSKETGVNELRIMIKSNRIVIHPRCKHLIAQLRSCIWDNKREKFDRVDGYFHFDLVDCLIYAVRGVRRAHNPYPADKYKEDTQFFASQPSQLSNNARLFSMVFKPKKFGA